MGDLVLKGATSGQITLSPVGTAGTNTLTLPAKTGNIITSADTGTVTQTMLGTNVAGNGPAFSAYLSSAQTLSSATATKIQFNATEFNLGSCFDNTTNYRFTPTTAGYYQINCIFAAATSSNSGYVMLYKDNAVFKYGALTSANALGFIASASFLVYANGTNYFEIYGYLSTGVGLSTGASNTLFQASLVRAA